MKRTLPIIALFAALLFLAGCENDDETVPTGNNPDNNLQIHGIVADESGTALTGVSLHVVYDIEPPLLRQHPPEDHGCQQNRRSRASLDSVELGAFALYCLNNAARISWRTLSEINNDRFNILRNNYVIAHVAGQGSSAIAHDYTFVDQSVVNGETYLYELRAVDFEGVEQYLASDTVTPSFWCGFVTEYALHQNFPNPVEDNTIIAFDLPANSSLEMKMFTFSGTEIRTLLDGLYASGRHSFDCTVSDLPNGLYRYRLTVGTSIFTAEKTMLKNTMEYETLRSTAGIDTTDTAGRFAFDPCDGDTVYKYGSLPLFYGTLTLDYARIVALKDGYSAADTLVSLAGNTHHSLTFTLNAVP